jgi:hypothetical protein
MSILNVTYTIILLEFPNSNNKNIADITENIFNTNKVI